MKRKSLSILLILTLVIGSFGLAFADTTYTVKKGDTLWDISKLYDTTWQTLGEYNKLKNPHLIFPNQAILIPDDKPVPEPQPQPAPAPTPGPAPIEKEQVSAQTQEVYESRLS